jgi:hypothetical protein
MPKPATTPAAIFDAFRKASERGELPTSLGTAELRELGADVLSSSVFTARGTNAIYVSKLKEVIDQLAAGDINFATARWTLMEALKATGYTPEGGFPDVPDGTVPPALAGTLQDLSSKRRIEFILKTQIALVRGKGQQFRGQARADAFPAWELVRVYQVTAPRDWPSRWAIAGGPASPSGYAGTGRMIALKGDPVWGELGSYENFTDALGVDHPPFAFNSGMGWREVAAGEVRKLGITGPNGESPKDWQKSGPATLDGKLPVPQLDVNQVDPELLKKLQERDGVVVQDGTAMRPEDADKIRDGIEARRAAREARKAARLEKSISDRQEEYANR